ncbi:MAG: hypothetical protein Q9O74_06505 [Planctomycetota bacterium]|nr:hypothetical protein [Planctomycetota bacterium]
MTRHARTRTRTTLALAALAALLAGCTSAENDRFRFGDAAPLAVFEPAADTLADLDPHATSFDRSGWEPIVMAVPVHGTAHQPTYAPSAFSSDTLPRQRGEYPTAETCLDLGEPDASEDLRVAAATHGMAIVDTVLFIPRLIIRPPTATDWSPAQSYSRVSGHDQAPPACCRACGGKLCEACATPESEAEPVDTKAPDAGTDEPTDGFFDEADALDETETPSQADAT